MPWVTVGHQTLSSGRTRLNGCHFSLENHGFLFVSTGWSVISRQLKVIKLPSINNALLPHVEIKWQVTVAFHWSRLKLNFLEGIEFSEFCMEMVTITLSDDIIVWPFSTSMKRVELPNF
jgi:hypothetical protein